MDWVRPLNEDEKMKKDLFSEMAKGELKTFKEIEKVMKLKTKKEREVVIIHMVNEINKHLLEKRVKKIDSNFFHFVIYNSLQKFPELKKEIPYGWFCHGPYSPLVDDVLVKHFKMEKKYHQIKGKEPFCYEFSDTEFSDEKTGKGE